LANEENLPGNIINEPRPPVVHAPDGVPVGADGIVIGVPVDNEAGAAA